VRFCLAALIFAVASTPSLAGTRADEKAAVADLIEAIETDAAVADLGYEPIINAAQAEFLDSLQQCKIIDHYSRKRHSAHLWVECPEPVAAGPITSIRWSVEIGFTDGQMTKFEIFNLELRPMDWEPGDG